MSPKFGPILSSLLCAVAYLATSAGAIAAVPTITSFTPGAAKLNTPVTITGTNFVAPVKVAFAGVNAASVTLVSATKITAYVPLAAPTGQITVTAAGGTVTSASVFTVVPGITVATAIGEPTATPTVFFSSFGAYEAVDVYFDTADEAVSTASATGAGSLVVTIPAGATPGTHWLTAIGRHSGYAGQLPFLVRTDWPEVGFRAYHQSDNVFENVVAPSTVANLQQSWSTVAFAQMQDAPAVVGGVVYASFSDSTVRAFDEITGNQKWVAQLTGGGADYSSPAVVGGDVYVGLGTSLYALNAATGALVWTVSTAGDIFCSPVVVNGTIYFGSYDGYVRALNATTGALIWNYDIGAGVYASPAVYNGVLYVGAFDGNVYALNATSGTKIWSTSIGTSVTSSATLVGSLVCVGSNNNSMYALHASTGAVAWTYAATAEILSTAAVVGSEIFFGASDGTFYSLTAANGKLRWSATLSANAIDCQVCAADGVIYAGDGTYTYALAQSNGALLATLPTSGQYGGPVVVNGAVVIGDVTTGSLSRYTPVSPSGTYAVPRPEPAALQRRELR